MRTIILILACSLLLIPCKAETIIVDPNGSADFDHIQDAINYSWHGDTVIVRPGTYNENVFFNGRAITLTSEGPNDTNIVETTIITASSPYSVTFDLAEGNNSILTGFTVTGTGIFCYASSPTISKNIIRNCTGYGIRGDEFAAPVISQNTISGGGSVGINWCLGPISNNTITNNIGPGLKDCDGTIKDNVITGNSGMGWAGGLYNCDGDIIGNLISGNSTISGGGGLGRCNGTIEGNIISGNIAEGDGGGLHLCNGTIINNIISGNKSHHLGGGLSDCGGYITNNTIVGNYAPHRAGLYLCDALIKNNVIAFNRASTPSTTGGIYGPCTSTYNNLWLNFGGNFGDGATAGIGDISRDPLFATNGYWSDPLSTPADTSDDVWVDGDYYLKSVAGRWDPNTESWIYDDVNSPCIDAGDPSDPIGFEPNPNGGRINQGVYGGTAEASKSPSGIIEPVCKEYPTMDFNKDCKVGFADLAIFLQSWLDCGFDPPEACWE